MQWLVPQLHLLVFQEWLVCLLWNVMLDWPLTDWMLETVALVVIMFELTGALHSILPFMIAAAVAKWFEWLILRCGWLSYSYSRFVLDSGLLTPSITRACEFSCHFMLVSVFWLFFDFSLFFWQLRRSHSSQWISISGCQRGIWTLHSCCWCHATTTWNRISHLHCDAWKDWRYWFVHLCISVVWMSIESLICGCFQRNYFTKVFLVWVDFQLSRHIEKWRLLVTFPNETFEPNSVWLL